MIQMLLVLLHDGDYAKESGISFCNEKYFDNLFQDKQYIYLNVFDEKNSENRLYRWFYGSSQIDQFVTANVDKDFLIPQSGVFMSRYNLSMRTYYQPKESQNVYVTICNRFGPEMRPFYNLTNPYPLFPICNCSILKPFTEIIECGPQYTARILPERLKKYQEADQFQFPFILPEGDSLNNKYRSMYFQNFNVSRNQTERLFVFKRHEVRELTVTENFFNDELEQRKVSYKTPIDMEVVGLVSIYDDAGNITVSYLLEEVAIDEINYIAQYIWEVDVFTSNYSLFPRHRRHWREFFGCHSTTALPLFTVLLLLLYTIIVVVAIILSVMYFYFDYDLLLMKAKQTTLSYYFS
ncbi:hypothetical protein TYRP_003423 [Tyrophagus putrescentiae]|nr:hypothetical protein TYRP_003423 [Tyrophagus putrescentiae]